MYYRILTKNSCFKFINPNKNAYGGFAVHFLLFLTNKICYFNVVLNLSINY